MRNFVVKHDFNRSSTHRDRKNDYDRSQVKGQIIDEIDEVLETSTTKTDADIDEKLVKIFTTTTGDPVCISVEDVYQALADSASDIAAKEYMRAK